MATGEWTSAVESEAALRAAAARRWAWTYVVVAFVSVVLVAGSRSLGLLALCMAASGVLWVLCLVAAVRVLQHGREYGHEEGRVAGFVGFFLTLGFVGLLVAYLLHPGARR